MFFIGMCTSGMTFKRFPNNFYPSWISQTELMILGVGLDYWHTASGNLTIDGWKSDSYCNFSGCYTNEIEYDVYLVEALKCTNAGELMRSNNCFIVDQLFAW